MKSFKYWKRQQVEETFGLKRLKELDLLSEWLKVDTKQITTIEQERILELQETLKENILDWNEAELKFYFLGPFMLFLNFKTKQYRSFAERPLSAIVGKETASGYVDFFIAQGEQIPKALYFCLHEYKPEEGTSNDPLGQLLIAMVAAQQANQRKNDAKEIPIYGAYVLGRHFYFGVLNGKQYAFSDAYTATQSDIFEIFCVFKKLKSYIEDLLQ